MTQNTKKKMRDRGAQKGPVLPFTKDNYRLFGIGLVVILVGYIALARGPWDSFWSLTLAPILLVLGYCVIIPVAILYKKKQLREENATE